MYMHGRLEVSTPSAEKCVDMWQRGKIENKAWFILNAPHPQCHKISSHSNLHKFYDQCGL